jgi:hypothetical protein
MLRTEAYSARSMLACAPYGNTNNLEAILFAMDLDTELVYRVVKSSLIRIWAHQVIINTCWTLVH